MSDLVEYLKSEITVLERDIRQGEARAQQFAVKARKEAERVAELSVVLKYHRDRLSKATGGTESVPQSIGRTAASAEGAEGKEPTMRSVLTGLLRDHEFITAQEVMAAIKESLPNIQENSILGELSRAGKRGDLERTIGAKGKYRSLIFQPPASAGDFDDEYVDDLDTEDTLTQPEVNVDYGFPGFRPRSRIPVNHTGA